MFSCSSFYFLFQPISTSTPICRKRKEDAKKVEAINSFSDDSDIEIVWPLPDSNSRIRPRAPIPKPKYVSPVGQNKVKCLWYHEKVFLYIFYYNFFLFSNRKNLPQPIQRKKKEANAMPCRHSTIVYLRLTADQWCTSNICHLQQRQPLCMIQQQRS